MSESIEITIRYPGGHSDNAALVRPLGGDRYRVEEQPVTCLLVDDEKEFQALPNYADIIEAHEIEPGVLEFVSVLERAPLKRFTFLLSLDIAESEPFKEILDKVESNGGYWDRVFGGVVFIAVPKNGAYDPTEDLRNVGVEL